MESTLEFGKVYEGKGGSFMFIGTDVIKSEGQFLDMENSIIESGFSTHKVGEEIPYGLKEVSE